MPVNIYYFDPVTGVFTNRGGVLKYGDPMPPDATEMLPAYVPDPNVQHTVFRDGDWVVEDKSAAMLEAQNKVIAGEDRVAELEARVRELEAQLK